MILARSSPHPHALRNVATWPGVGETVVPLHGRMARHCRPARRTDRAAPLSVRRPSNEASQPGDRAVFSVLGRWQTRVVAGGDSGAGSGARLGRRWDVALSFAGAQREYVEQVAAALR